MIFQKKEIDEEEMAKFISKETKIDLEIVMLILDTEFKYLENNGLIKRSAFKW